MAYNIVEISNNTDEETLNLVQLTDRRLVSTSSFVGPRLSKETIDKFFPYTYDRSKIPNCMPFAKFMKKFEPKIQDFFIAYSQTGMWNHVMHFRNEEDAIIAKLMDSV